MLLIGSVLVNICKVLVLLHYCLALIIGHSVGVLPTFMSVYLSCLFHAGSIFAKKAQKSQNWCECSRLH